MIVSAEASEINSLTSEGGRVIDALSELSLPSYDPEGAPADLKVRPLPDLPDEEEEGMQSAITSKAVVPEESEDGDGKEQDKDKAEEAKNKAQEAELTRQLLEERYHRTPSERIIIALAMCAAHVEVRERERNMAAAWLETWSNQTREYKIAILKGKNLCGL